jgi:hypothetical protein
MILTWDIRVVLYIVGVKYMKHFANILKFLLRVYVIPGISTPDRNFTSEAKAVIALDGWMEVT